MNKVIILLSTYNGEKYLNTQLESLYGQLGVDIHIVVRDDGSKDRTVDILQKYSKDYGKMTIIEGENKGAILSFYELMKYASETFDNTCYYAFCDQDDYWKEDKLKRAVDMNDNNAEVFFYHSCYEIVDSELNYLSQSSNRHTKGTLGEALIANQAIGCSMVMTHKVLSEASKICGYETDLSLPYHDVWTYLVALSIEAKIVFDDYCSLKYRQHGNNVIGLKKNAFSKLKFQYSNLIHHKNLKSGFASLLLELVNVTSNSKETLLLAKNYRNSFGNKMKLVCNREFRTKRLYRNIAFIYFALKGDY